VRTRAAFFLAATVAAVLLLVWLLIPRPEEEAARRIESRAKSDLVEACNLAAVEAGLALRFTIADVVAPRRDAVETTAGVATLASVLRARRNGRICAWNGIDPATIAPAG
jgi:hypothetical protein